MNRYTEFALEANSHYKNIDSISFTPLKEVKVTKKYSKGDKIFWKWLGFIPIFPYKVDCDLYLSENVGVDGLHSLEFIKDHSWYNLCFINGKLYRTACVNVSRINSNSYTRYFESNEEAIKFIDDLKIKCKGAGNELK